MCVCLCSSTGTLTAVDSFLTFGAGPEVRNYISHKSMLWIPVHEVPIFFIIASHICVCDFGFLFQGGVLHDGTWQSAVHAFSDGHELQDLRRKFNHKPLPSVGSKLKRR